MSHRLARLGDGDPVPREAYRAIARAAPEDGGAFYGHGEGTEYPSVGFTSLVRDADSPDIAFNTEHRADGWHARPVASESKHGTNDSWALQAGTHDVPGEQGHGGLPVQIVVSAPIAAKIVEAEDEHNDDYEYAAEQILDAADDWFSDHMQADYGPAATAKAAEDLVTADVNAKLGADLELNGVAAFDYNNLVPYYTRACALTLNRDTEGWHSFDDDADGPTEQRLEDRVVRTVGVGTTEIGTHLSADVIDLDDVH